MQAKVSVIIPVYNTAAYLRPCLDSVCGQTLKELEIICVNDCSTDGSSEILREYARRDERIILIDFPQNCGVSAARNAGIDRASGAYLGFVDSDDRIAPDYYEKLFSAANGADIIKGKVCRMINGKACADVFISFFDDHRKIRENRGNFFYFLFSAIYRRDFISRLHIRFYEDLHYGEDVCFIANASAHAESVVCEEGTVYYYVQSENSAMERNLKDSFLFFHDEMIAVDRLAEDIARDADPDVYNVQFQKILNIVLMNMTYFSFSEDFRKRWIDFALAKYKGKSDIKRLFQAARADYLGLFQKGQLEMIRKRLRER